MLEGVGHIKISGGCEVHAEAEIIVGPVDGNEARVRVDNSGKYFFDGNSEVMASFEAALSVEDLSVFIKDWIRLTDAVEEETDLFSTRNAEVSFDLPLRSRNFRYSGADRDWCRLDPILDSLESFVVACREKASASGRSETPSFSGNRTEDFLGNPEERKKAVFQFSDMSGLYGGRLVVVTGAGNVMVQVASYDPERKKLWEKRYSFDLSPEQADEIVAEIIENDVMAIRLEKRTGVPDETRLRFSMTNAGNETFILEDWERSSLMPGTASDHPRVKFDRTCLALRRLVHRAETEESPLQEGPFGAA